MIGRCDASSGSIGQHEAPRRDEDAFALHYQPRVTPDGKIVGAEALLRWPHPSRGMLYPDSFIPFLEQSGLIDTVGEWVIRTACRQARAWRDRGQALRVSANISMRQFHAGTLAAIVRSALHEARLEPCLLELELTESVLIDGSDSIIAVLDELKRIGVSIAIDDFGTGFSSLAYLKLLPIDHLKIDRTFVRGLSQDHRDLAIVRTIAALASSLGLSLVAEGVETEDDVRALAEFRCSELQGYLYGRPMAVIEFDARLEGTNAPSASHLHVVR